MNTSPKPLQFIAVYCASSSKAAAAYFQAAHRLGALLADAAWGVICGAGNQGLMAALSESTLEQGGYVVGIIPRFMQEEGWMHDSLSEYVVTETMHERKAAMMNRAASVVALPGGCGTMEELLEAITWKQLGLYTGSIVILNTNGFYNALIAQLQSAIDESLMREEHGNLWQVANTPEEAISFILSSKPSSAMIRRRAAL